MYMERLLMRRRALFTRIAVILLAAAPFASAQEPDRDALLRIAKSAYFHVDVAGVPRLQGHPLHVPERSGKAFAVSPNMLVTALHVLGENDEWRIREIANPMLARAVRPLERTISLTSADRTQPITDAVVVGASSSTLNAAGLRLQDTVLPEHFDLSFCSIDPDGSYWALLSGHAAPGDAASVSRPQLMALTPVSQDEIGLDELGGLDGLGGLAAFRLLGQDAPVIADWGHDGSPIFDADSNVVAIVSAVTDLPGGLTIFATPVQPMIPGSLRQLAEEPDPQPAEIIRHRCSMADTVKRIHDQLNAHSIWNVSIDRNFDPGERKMIPSGDIVIEYENVAEAPNVQELVVVYDVNGKLSPQRDYGRISEPPDVADTEDYSVDPFEIRLSPEPGERKFVLRQAAGLIGKYEANMKRRWSDGYIQEFVLHLYPVLDGKTEPEPRAITRRIPYIELR